jgi:hypothetical protein
MGRKARFRRVASTPITLRLDGVPSKIPPNGMFISTVEMVGNLPGIRFEGFIDSETSSSTTPVDPVKEWQQIVSKSANEDNAVENIDTIMGSVVTEDTIVDSPNSSEPSPPVTETSQSVPGTLSLDVLMELKKKDNRAWMVMTKKELKATMRAAGVDFSHVPDDRNQLYKFLSGIVKSL